jgi:hypothetical protein
MDNVQDNLTSMEGCFEILIPKNEFIEQDMDFDALLRGEASSHQTMDDGYKEVCILKTCIFYINLSLGSLEYCFSWFGLK